MKALPIKDLALSKITSPFGYRIHPITKVKTFHGGIDLGYPKSTPVYAVDDGTVFVSKMQSNGKGLGNYIVIKHSNYYSLYAHLDKRIALKGNIVKAGTKIGEVGTTGDSTGYHLHFGICSIYVASNVSKSNWYDPTAEIKELIEEGKEMVTKAKMANTEGETVEVERILKDGTNYVKMRDFELLCPSVKVSYNKEKKMPEVAKK